MSASPAAASADECEECVAGKFSNTSGVAACTDCAAGSYSTVLGSVSAADCQQVRVEGRQSERKDKVSLTNFLVAVRSRQIERTGSFFRFVMQSSMCGSKHRVRNHGRGEGSG